MAELAQPARRTELNVCLAAIVACGVPSSWEKVRAASGTANQGDEDRPDDDEGRRGAA